MITTTSLLCEAVTAFCTSLNLQRLKSLWLSARSFLACFALKGRISVGRYFTPCLRAAAISRFTLASEPFWHTTRVVPGGLALSVEASERAVGTLPPAAGFTELSGPGFGQ